MGFKLNPYDRCVANKEINGKQCTIIWYVDDLKISHKSYNMICDDLKPWDDPVVVGEQRTLILTSED